MATQTNVPGKAYAAAAAVTEFRLVAITSTGAVQHAVASTTNDVLGVAQEPQATVGKPVPVRFRKAGTAKVCADGSTIAAGDVVYKGAAGKISATSSGSVRVGIAHEASSADGDIIEVALD